ncbi:MAG: adenylate kinase [Clostridia bacterium]|nr:adenylate kinase [Clostridia bacterium]
MKLVLLGPPGAGKGTQAVKLAEEFNIPAISTGHIIRNAIADGTPVGIEAKAFIERGELVPDSIVVEIVQERLKDKDCANGYILDGFPRTVSQAEIMEQLPIPIDLVIEIHVDADIIIERLSGRRECKTCGATYHVHDNPPQKEGVCDRCNSPLIRRDDDVPDIIKNRIRVYGEQTEPLKAFYQKKGLLVSVNGQNMVSDTTEAVINAIKERNVEAGV